MRALPNETAEQSKFYVRYLFYRVHMTVRMRHASNIWQRFQGISISDGRCESNQCRSAVK